MVSGACLCGVSELSSEKGIGRKAKWMGAFSDWAEAELRQTIPKTTKIKINAVDEYFNRLETCRDRLRTRFANLNPPGREHITWPS
jgi:hypothetical protein